MKLKKLAAGVLAAVMAVSTAIVMPVTASAASTLYSATQTTAGGGNLLFESNFLNYVSEEKAAEIASVQFDMSISGAYSFAKVCIGYNMGADPWWGQSSAVELANQTPDNIEVSQTITFSASGVRASGDGAGYFKLQFDWVNENTTVTISDFTLLDASGNAIYPAPAPAPEPEPEPDEEEIPDAPEGVTPIIGTYADGKYVQDFSGAATGNTGVVDVDTETTNDTIASLVDGNLYIYTLVAEEDLAEAKKGVVYIKNVDTDVSLKVTTTNAFTKLYDGAEAAEGNVFVAYVISGVTDAADWAWSDIVIE